MNRASDRTPKPLVIFTGGLFFFALLYFCHVAAQIVVPLVLAFMLKIVFVPFMRFFERMRVPKPLAALVVFIGLIGLIVGALALVSKPSIIWADKLLKEVPKIQYKLEGITTPMEPFQKVLEDAQAFASDNTQPRIVVNEASLNDRFTSGAGKMALYLFETLLLLYFMLIAGDKFLRRVVEVLPGYRNKKRAILISDKIQKDLSVYLGTITCMNFGVGALTALAMYACGMTAPVMWGVIAFFLNFVPVGGPLAGVVLFGLAGLTTFDTAQAGLLPAGLYFLIHCVESEFLTPMLLAKHFTLNPVIVVFGLMVFYALWGIPGIILATPVIAVSKIIFDHVNSLAPIGHLMED